MGPATPGLTQTADAYLFATCAGRLSALMEHQWLISDPAADVTALERDAMLSLVDAVVAPKDRASALGWRVGAKAAQAALLTRARFGTDARAAGLAARQAEEHLGQCRSLLLG